MSGKAKFTGLRNSPPMLCCCRRTLRECATIASCPNSVSSRLNPGRMCTRFQSNSTGRHILKRLFHGFRVGRDLRFQNHRARSAENTLEGRPISQVESDGQPLLALDRNVRVLSPIEMSVYRTEAVCMEELCVCPESESSRRDELLSGHTARCGGVVQTSCLPTIHQEQS
jgi:hypothetical protein